MRWILKCGTYFALTVFSSSAQCEYNTSELFKDCTIASRVVSGQSRATADSMLNVLHCVGYVEAAALGMRQAHELYGIAFPNLTKSLLGTDEQLARKYMSALILYGEDVCIPDGTTVQTLTMLVVNHLNADPKELSNSPIRVINRAWANAFPCEIPP
jgi:Rap1a immunity proteins